MWGLCRGPPGEEPASAHTGFTGTLNEPHTSFVIQPGEANLEDQLDSGSQCIHRQWAGGPCGTLWGWRTATSFPWGLMLNFSFFLAMSGDMDEALSPSSSSRGKGPLAGAGGGGDRG